MKFLRSGKWLWVCGMILTAFTAYVLLDTFVIPRSFTAVSDAAVSSVSSSEETESRDAAMEKALKKATLKRTAGDSTVSAETVSETATADSAVTKESSSESFSDNGITIGITTYRENNTEIYAADITLSSADQLKTALAKNTYGKNVTEKTSAMAEEHDAVLAINGDYYGAQNSGYVIRNGTLYRDKSSGTDTEDLVIYPDGTWEIIREGDITAAELLNRNAWQVFSFGPALVENGTVAVSDRTEVQKAMASNPRTAIGMISSLHYVFVVSDGRTGESAGLSVKELAEFMADTLGCETAYNLDGGGSSTMYFNGSVVNKPTTNGNKISERSVSDIVYIGKK